MRHTVVFVCICFILFPQKKANVNYLATKGKRSSLTEEILDRETLRKPFVRDVDREKLCKTISETRIIHKSLIGNALSDTNHFRGLKDSVHKQGNVA